MPSSKANPDLFESKVPNWIEQTQAPLGDICCKTKPHSPNQGSGVLRTSRR
jgi:hypothetical protein